MLYMETYERHIDDVRLRRVSAGLPLGHPIAATVVYWLRILTLLYLIFAMLPPSATLAEVADGSVYGV